MKDTIQQVRKELIENSEEQVKHGSLRFFREEVKPYGVKSAVVRQIAKKHMPPAGKEEVFRLCEQLFQSGYLEESFIACHWSYAMKKQYEPGDIAVFGKWLDLYITNWATCDTLCNHTIGELVGQYPECISKLKKWAHSENRWVRRAAAASLIIPARKGLFLPDIFQIADILLQDRDDMVQKGYGWMLKSASQAHQQEVSDYVMKKRRNMPRTALRYAIEKMPIALRQKAMT